MKRRILTIAVAILLAVIGTGAVLIYVRQADARALAGQKAVTALVATQQIPAGTTASGALRAGLLRSQRLPAESVPTDAVRSITPGLTGMVFSTTVAPGQLLLRPMLVTTLQTATGLPVPPGKVAVTIQMCVQKAVAGYIHPGSEIAIFNTFYNAPPGTVTATCSGTNWAKGATGIRTRLVLDKVQVLAVGPASAAAATPGATNTAFAQNSSSSATQTTVLVTVAVDQKDAERVIELAEAYIPYLALMTNASGTSPDVVFNP